MLNIHRLLVSSCLVLFCAFLIAHAQPRNLSMRYKQTRDTQGDHLVIAGEADFPVSSVSLNAVAVRASGTQNLTIPAPTIVPTFSDPATIKGARFSVVLDFGPAGPLTDDMEALIVEATAQLVSLGADAGTMVKDRIKIDMQFVKSVRRLQKIADETPIASPNLSIGGITALDTAIFIRVNSNMSVRVRASAFSRANLLTPVANSDEVEIPSNGSALLKLSPLSPDSPYQVKVVETSPHPGRPAEERTIVQDLSSALLKTRSTIPTPSVSFQSGPDIKIVNNRSIRVPLTVTNSPRIKLTLEAQNDLGVFTPVESPSTQVLSVPTNSPQTADVRLPLQLTTLDAKTSYRLKVEGLTQFDEAASGPAILSNTFKGLGALLTKGVDLEFTSQGIKFLADTNQVPAKIEVKVGGTPQTFSYAASTAAGDPAFLLSYDVLRSALGTSAGDNPRLPLTIGVRAEDGSERENVISIALKIDPSELNAKPSNTKTKIASFVQELKSDPNLAPDRGRSIKVGDILKTGLSVLLRFLVPIP